MLHSTLGHVPPADKDATDTLYPLYVELAASCAMGQTVRVCPVHLSRGRQSMQ